jgi:NitT/TauT family transport system substrate-binding protein
MDFMRIRIGHLSTFYHTAIFLMAKGGAEERLGAAIEWRLMGTGPAIMQAFQRNELDLAYIGLPPAIIGIDQGMSVLCIAGGHVEGTIVAGKSGCKTFADLRDTGAVLRQFAGCKIGVPGKGSIHDVILRVYLERFGLDREVEIKNYPWADLVLDAVVSGEVSAAAGTPALAAAIKRFAQGCVLVPPPELWPNNPSYGIVARRDFLQKAQDTVQQFLQLHEEATEQLRTRPGETARLIADFVGIVDRELVLDAIGISPKYCAHLSDAYIESTMRFVPVLKKLGYIRSEVAREKIFFRDLIDRVHPEKDHY